jgi:hypothetical protein
MERKAARKAGQPWSHNAVLTALHNSAYIGEVFFRDTYRQGAHPTLIDMALFDRVGALLSERGENHANEPRMDRTICFPVSSSATAAAVISLAEAQLDATTDTCITPVAPANVLANDNATPIAFRPTNWTRRSSTRC